MAIKLWDQTSRYRERHQQKENLASNITVRERCAQWKSCCQACYFLGATISVTRPIVVSPVYMLPCESMAM
jgi:hypothetical protein